MLICFKLLSKFLMYVFVFFFQKKADSSHAVFSKLGPQIDLVRLTIVDYSFNLLY